MKEKEEVFPALEQIADSDARKIAGGYYVKNDRYTIEEYSKSGVAWQRNFWEQDCYYIKGIQITQAMAEEITNKSIILGRQLTDDELRILGVHL